MDSHRYVAQNVFNKTSVLVRFETESQEKLTFFSDDVYQDVDHDEGSRPPDAGTEHITGCLVIKYFEVYESN